jgi:hypothetical protein
MFMLQQLHGEADDDTAQLFTAAMAADCQRVVLKRPQKAPFISKQTTHISDQWQNLSFRCLSTPLKRQVTTEVFVR